MASAKAFVTKVSQIDGVAGCLLVRNDGVLLGQTLDDPEIYATLLGLSGSLATEVMNTSGFSYCRYLCFGRRGKRNFYVFPIGKYLLGVVQRSDCYVAEMLEAVYRLLGRVSTSSSGAEAKGS